jgi:hypothetical protein
MEKVDNFIIPKKANSRQIKQFRNIHIYEADWNAMISIKWKEALKKSEECHMIQSNQFRSRKQKSTMHPLQLEISQLEISRRRRQQYGQINYDARACYDRILLNIAAMASRKYGIPETLANLYYKTPTNTKYRVKITGGTKRYVYSNNKKTPIYGTGQGSGNSPIIWLFIFDIIAQIMEENAIGATYLGEEKQQPIKIKMTAYVDDINTHHTNNPGEHTIESNMRHNYNTWKSLLEASGGQLAPENVTITLQNGISKQAVNQK